MMLEELERRNYSQSAVRAYIRTIKDLARYFKRPPDQLGPDQLRQPVSQVLPERVLPELCHLQAESPIPGKSDNKTSAGGGLSPNVAAVIENSLAGEGQPKPEAVLLAGRDERLEQPVANPIRNARPRIFDFDQYTAIGFLGCDVEPPPTRHRFESVGYQIEKYALHTRTYQRQLDSFRHFKHDLNATVSRGRRCRIGCCSDNLPDVTHLSRRCVSKCNAVEICQ
jgi:hypothetical protein